MVALFALLLVIFLVAFFQFDQVTTILNNTFGASSTNSDQIIIATAFGREVLLSISTLRAFLGGGIVFFELMIIVLSVTDRIFDTVKAAIRPIVTLLPLGAFIYSAYTTFEPIIRRLLPPPVGGQELSMTAAINTPTFDSNILLTFFTMLLYLIVAGILGRADNSKEIKALRAEIKKLRQQQRR